MAREVVLCLDPSSTVTGWAVLDAAGRLVAAGVLLPERRSAPSYERICAICDSLVELLDEFAPTTIVIEWTKGKVGKRHGGLGAGLAVYGCGVGAQAMTARIWAAAHGAQVVPVLENEWTRGVPKAARQAAVASEYPAYRPATDPGGDIADAIALGTWYGRERKFFRLLTNL